MSARVDLELLARRENEQTEWKERVADVNDVAQTLSAFANDLQNLGGGYVVCGAKEDRDEHGFPRLVRVGLSASELKEVEGRVLALCRERVTPSIAPLVEELPTSDPSRRVLVFIQPATASAHTFRRQDHGAKHFVRVSRSTIEARNGVLKDLLVRKGALEPWDRRPCLSATEADIDLLAMRDAFQRMGVFSPERGVEPYISAEEQLSPFVPPLFAREPLTGVLRPRNFTLLLFGRNTQRHIPGAVSLFALYPGSDRSTPHAERHELSGTLLEQAKRLQELLDVQSYTAFDKTDHASPNALKYPKRALYEAMGNALAHRDYELVDPLRITVFVDRIEVVSPGSLPLGVKLELLRGGTATPRWRNQSLGWFFTRLQLGQAEGQGIATILRTMKEEGNPPPVFDADEARVSCVLPAHPRHALLGELREAERSVALGRFQDAAERVTRILAADPLHARAVGLFAEVQQALKEPEPVVKWAAEHEARLMALPFDVLLQLAEAIETGTRSTERLRISRQILATASRGRLEERELRRLAVAMSRAKDDDGVLALVERYVAEHPGTEPTPVVRQLRGDALIGLAKECRATATRPGVSKQTRARAWRDFHRYLADAEAQLRGALQAATDPHLKQLVDKNLEYLEKLKAENQPPHLGQG